MIKKILQPETENKFHMTVDHEAEACYIKLSDQPLHHTEELIPCDLMVDYDKKGNIIGIEILRDVELEDITHKYTKEQ